MLEGYWFEKKLVQNDYVVTITDEFKGFRN